MDAVIKIGGSLADNPEALKELCAEVFRIAKKHAILVVPGGGKFADVVRELDSKFALTGAISHKMAILAMDQYGLLLSQVIPSCEALYSLKDAKLLSESGKVAVMLPSKLLFCDDSFEPSWDVTSDSIAAYIAVKVGASKLILVTDVDGIFTEDPKLHKDAVLLSKVLVNELQVLSRRTSVDKFLPEYLTKHSLECYVVNGQHPERVSQILSGNQTTYTQILPRIQV